MKNSPFIPNRPKGRPPRRMPPPLPPSCCDGGYIVERIVHRQSETICFDGLLNLSGLPCGLCGPLSLCGAEVVQIRPTGCPAPSDPCRPRGGCDPCSPCNPCNPCGGCDWLAVTLACSVVDARGCSGEGLATIQVQSCAQTCAQHMGTNVRRGAQVCVGCARFCPPNAFEVSLKLSLQTLYSRSEWTGGRPPVPQENCCMQALPLYPPPVRRFQ